MGDSFLPSNEATLVQWANNLVSYAVTHTAQTGLSTAVVTEFTARRNDFQNSILLTETSKSAYRANVKTKKLKQKSIRPLARVGYKNVPDSKTAVLRTKFPCPIECEARHGGTRLARRHLFLDSCKRSIEDYARYLNQLVQGNPAATDETKLGLGLTVKKKPQKREPEIPADVRQVKV